MSETLVTCKDRTYTVQQKSCAERIAPIGTLSQNGYGEDLKAYKSAYTKTNFKTVKKIREQEQQNKP